MIKTMLKPFFKKHLGLFISMVVVSSLAIALLCTFGSTIVNLGSSYRSYLNTYGDVDEQISYEYTSRDNILALKNEITEIEELDARLSIDVFLKKDEGRPKVARIFSFKEDENKIFKRYIVDTIEKSPDYVNISICKKFANNNNIKLGQTIKLGYLNKYIDLYINEIVETSEGIYPRANDYIWSDNQDFGYLYLDEIELNKGLLELAEAVRQELENDPEFAADYAELIETTGLNIPDLRTIDVNFVSQFSNQVIVRNKDGYSSSEVLEKIATNLEAKGVTIKTKTIGENLPYKVYMENAQKQLRVAAIFLPIFFYSVTMIVIALFMNQIIKQMTPEIGIMSSIGIDKKQIVSLFLMFGLLMSIVSGIIGSIIGYLINRLMTEVLIRTYNLPIIPSNLYPAVVTAAIVLLVIFALLATFLSCLAIFKITPKDAVISNEAKRKNLPKWANKLVDKSPMNIKLGLNSIFQNPKRFFVSTFSMFASMVLILLSCFFFVSKEEMMSQSVERRLNFDCQVYLTSKATDEEINNLKALNSISSIEDCYYTYLKATKDNKDIYLESLAVNLDQKMIYIPDNTGNGSLNVKEEGIIIPKSIAESNNIAVGDYLSINGKNVKVTDLSFQYFHPLTYMSKAQMDVITNESVSSFVVNVKDELAFLNYLTENNTKCLTVFSSSLYKDLHSIFDSINVFIYIMIGFSLGMGFVILCIMSQNALLEQRRQISVMRAIGFRMLDISNLWTLQSLTQLVIATILAIPVGIFTIRILFLLISSAAQTYPFVLNGWVICLAIVFVLLVVLACHLISMLTIRRWNLADNTRCRE